MLFGLTVVEARHDGPVLRGVFAGEGGRAAGGAAFRAAVALSAAVNIETVAVPFERCVAYLDADEYRSTWLATRRSTERGSRWRTAASSSSLRRA